MTGLARLLLLAGLLAGGLWFAAEPLLVRQARQHLQAQSVAPQPRPGRLGLVLRDVVLPTDLGRLELPMLAGWVTPLAPLTARAVLPDRAVLDGPAGRRQLDLAGGRALLRLSPFGGALARAEARWAALSLDGVPLSGAAQASVRAVSDDRAAGAAYQVQLDLPHLRLSQVGAVQGGLKVWLDRPLGPRTAQTPPAVLAVMTEGLDLDGRRFRLRVIGLLRRGADGRAEGRLALYGSDAGAMLDAAITAGLLPQNVRLLARAMLNRLAGADFSAPSPAGQPPMPPAPEGEMRIPVEMKDGRMILGGIEIGPAPRWPAP